MREARLANQIAFLVEADKLKTVLRQTRITDGSRRENSAEHSWHLVLSAMVLSEYASEPIDLLRTMKMLAVHDLVEIDAGDTFAYDDAGNASKRDRETAAAGRIFGVLPADAANDARELWEEFESAETAEARFANAMDRIQPFLLNVNTGGGTWRIHNLKREQVLARMKPVEAATPRLWPMVLEAVDRFFSARAENP